MSWKTVIPLIPLIAINTMFMVMLPVFALKVRRSGLPANTDAKKHSGLIGKFFHLYLLWMIGPVERWLVRRRVSPNLLTGLSVLLSLGAAVALAMGHFGRGGWMYLFNGIVDIFDGRVARATGRVSDAGAFADSVADRLAEAAIFGGLAWYYRDRWVLLLVLLAMTTSFLVSYTRARGESLGLRGADIGAMQRPERIVFMGLGLVFSPVVTIMVSPATGHMRWPTVAGLALVALASAGTALHRFRFAFTNLERDAAKSVTAIRGKSSAPMTSVPATPAPSETQSEPEVAAVPPAARAR